MRKLTLHRETLTQLTPDVLRLVGGASLDAQARCAAITDSCVTMNNQCPTSGYPTCPAETHHITITGTDGRIAATR